MWDKNRLAALFWVVLGRVKIGMVVNGEVVT